MPERGRNYDVIDLAASIVVAYVANNRMPSTDLIDLIVRTYTALSDLKAGPAAVVPPAAPLMPAVPIRKSVTPDALICLEDGKKFKSLKRHLRTTYGMSPEQYRQKWGLPVDYPMVASAYAETRSAIAKSLGLGRKASAAADKRFGSRARAVQGKVPP